jgi:hypothetical protein
LGGKLIIKTAEIFHGIILSFLRAFPEAGRKPEKVPVKNTLPVPKTPVSSNNRKKWQK